MMFAFQLLQAIALGTAMGPVFDRYLYYLGGGSARGPTFTPKHARNSLVGMAESISGLSSLVLAIPVGLLVDRAPDRRAWLLRLAGVFGGVASVFAMLAVLTDYLMVLYVMLILLGVFAELGSSASEAIFTDSIPQGQRAGLFTTKAILSTVGLGCGPALSAVGLAVIGDEWEPYQMKAVLLTGFLMLPAASATLFFFADPPAAGRSMHEEASEDCQSPAPSSPESAMSAITTERSLGPLRTMHVPWLLAASDFITAIGAGMTVKFFNLFFIQDQHFSPVAICVLQTLYPLVIAVFMKFTERLAKPLGRPQASLLFFGSNVFCLFLLSEVQNLPLLLGIFLVRGGFANSVYPINRSIIMDFTPSSQRGRWNAVESFTSMTWSGSAFFGGWLSDAHDYRFTFLITAFLYAVGCLVYAPALKLVPRHEGDAAGSADRRAEAREVPLVTAAARAGEMDAQ